MQEQKLEINYKQQYEIVSRALQSYNNLLLKQDSFKVELDSNDGQIMFRNYMRYIQVIAKVVGVQSVDRGFRGDYSNAYKVLYTEGSLGYIPEIFDSAQEGFPFIYVNGHRYDFSMEILNHGEILVQSYYKMIHLLRFVHLRSEDNVKIIPENDKNQLKQRLEEFDRCWVQYEQLYIKELISIQSESKLEIREIISLEEQLTKFQQDQKKKGKIFISGQNYDDLRRKLCVKISKLNSVANVQGKGRDDLSLEVLIGAQKVLTTVTDFQSRSVRYVAEKIRQTYQNMRQVLRFFGENFQMVDPQLKNNPQLVSALSQYESFWQKGKRYFLQSQKQSQIVALSTIVNAAKQKHQNFTQLLEYSDPSVFWIIPSLIILRALQGEDQGLAESFLQKKSLQDYNKLFQLYKFEKQTNKGFCFYNKLQELLVSAGEDNSNSQQSASLLVMLNKIKELAVSLERVNPIDWNDMLGILLLEVE